MQAKKLSVATVFGKITPGTVAKGEHLLMRVMGYAIDTKEGTDQTGRPWKGLVGEFEATNLDTSEVATSSILFLPEIALNPILVALAKARGGSVSLAVEIGAVLIPEERRRPEGSFYEYTVRDLLPPRDLNPMAMLKAQIAAAKDAPSEDGPTTGSSAPDAPAPQKRTAAKKARK